MRRRLPVLWLAPLLGIACAAQAQAPAHDDAGQGDTPGREFLRQDLLGASLAGEFAVQAGRLDEAANWYLDAARIAGDDAGLAERATRIALLAGDDRRAADALALWRRSAPDSLPMLAAEATLSLRGKRDRVARRQLEALLRNPDPDGWRHAFTVLSSGGRDPQQAARILGQLVDRQAIPGELQAWMAFGGLAQRLDRVDLTERILDNIVARFPGEPRVALLRASQMRESGRADDARAALAPIAASAVLAPDLRLALAGEYEQLGDFVEAERILANGPQDGRSVMLRASLLARAEDKPALAALYEELKAGAAMPNPAQRLLLGQMAEYLGQFDEALEWYVSVPGGGERWQARLRGARVLHELGRTEAAYAQLRELQADGSADDDVRRNAYLLEAELHREDDAQAPELDAYNRGLAAIPDDPAVLYARALMWERRDDIPRAEADLRRILVSDPENVAALNALGYTLADRTNRYTEALELIDRARVAEPDNAAIVDSYGWVLYRLGRLNEALVELRRAFSMMKDPEVAAHIGEVLWALGRRDEARRYFDEARALDPENRSLLRALENTGA
ncbi:tetratricopeptide repeat protein [Luteimonas sp. BDR2-5]|uniref:tetratricopeptide repeat protein n=1 Tax=Proluteimonas luteida TaxID=2878685 RepID=UPI001E496F05|nr:tetratricopeptide repeat protein [Luteimonas sp. BDR2-5]MCD9028958.1 tetratricopeptide repeat protein [Luteimonas sp. BDR2-5]